MPSDPAGDTDAPDTNAPVPGQNETDDHLDALLDEALEETFPASDPIALSPRNAIMTADR